MSSLSFTSADDYLRYLQRERRVPIDRSGPVDNKYLKLTKREFQNQNLPFSPADHKGGALITDSIISELKTHLPREVSCLIGKEIAIGPLETGIMNAGISRSDDGWTAILINEGLFIFLNKFVKLTIAISDPGIVVYCNRKAAGKLTRADLLHFLQDAIDIYRVSGEPRGVMLKLRPEALDYVGWVVQAVELFVVCHELGHYLNGDLEDEQSMGDFGIPSAKILLENENHVKEFAADRKGFQLLESIYRSKNPSINLEHLLFPVSLFFEMLHEMGAKKTESHPNPRERSVNIAREFFDLEFADEFERAYTSLSAVAQLCGHI